MGVFDDLPCSDTDVAEVAIGDFATLVARSERVAYGEDGAIPPSSFTLTSAFPFEAQGVQVGHVVVLESYQGAGPRGAMQAFPIEGGVLPVDSVSGTTVTLKRLGYPSGQGAFPGPITGSIGVKFFVPSLLAQIVTASQDVKRQLGITINTGLINSTDLRLITILVVLRGLYWAQYRQANDDTYKSKMMDLDAQIAAQYASLTETYGDRSPRGRKALIGTMPDDPCWRVPSNGGDSLGW